MSQSIKSCISLIGFPLSSNALCFKASWPVFANCWNTWFPYICSAPSLLAFLIVVNCPSLWSLNCTFPSLALEKLFMACVPVNWADPPAPLLKLLNVARSRSKISAGASAAGSSAGASLAAGAASFPPFFGSGNFFGIRAISPPFYASLKMWFPVIWVFPLFEKFWTAETSPSLWSLKARFPPFSFDRFLNWWVPVTWTLPPLLFEKFPKVARSKRPNYLGWTTILPELLKLSNWWSPATCMYPALLVLAKVE